MQIQIPPDLAQFVEQEIASGRFPTPDDVLLAGLRLLKQDHDEAVRGIRDGISEWQRGEGVPLDESFAKLRSRLGISEGT